MSAKNDYMVVSANIAIPVLVLDFSNNLSENKGVPKNFSGRKKQDEKPMESFEKINQQLIPYIEKAFNPIVMWYVRENVIWIEERKFSDKNGLTVYVLKYILKVLHFFLKIRNRKGVLQSGFGPLMS